MIKKIRLGIKLFFVYIVTNKRQFLSGFFISVFVILFIPTILPYFSVKTPKQIGMVGNYTLSTLPLVIQNKISFGLIKLDANDLATSGAALSWQATDSGKTLIFNLDPNLKWQNGDTFTSNQINYNLKGVTLTRPNQKTIEFTMKEPFSPLLTLLSQPLFKDGLVGFSDTKIQNVKFNGRFLSSLNLTSINSEDQTIIKFFPTEKTLITALKLGNVREASNLHDSFGFTNVDRYKVYESIDGKSEAVLFFNNSKKPFDDKSIRQGLVYGLPDTFSQGEEANSPFSKTSWAQSLMVKKYSQNTQFAQKLAGGTKITITTNQELEPVANRIALFWKEASISAVVQISDNIPFNYDAYLTYVELPQDPDQYFLWHSTQNGNISNYKSFKVDKLLEEGRREIDIKLRKEIYASFLKAITEEVPAAFLFYPKIYTITRDQ